MTIAVELMAFNVMMVSRFGVQNEALIAKWPELPGMPKRSQVIVTWRKGI